MHSCNIWTSEHMFGIVSGPPSLSFSLSLSLKWPNMWLDLPQHQMLVLRSFYWNNWIIVRFVFCLCNTDLTISPQNYHNSRLATVCTYLRYKQTEMQQLEWSSQCRWMKRHQAACFQWYRLHWPKLDWATIWRGATPVTGLKLCSPYATLHCGYYNKLSDCWKNEDFSLLWIEDWLHMPNMSTLRCSVA